MCKFVCALLLAIGPIGSFGVSRPAKLHQPLGGVPRRPSPSLVKLDAEAAVDFERNDGQADDTVKFIARGSGYTLLLALRHAVLILAKPAAVDPQPGSGPSGGTASSITDPAARAADASVTVSLPGSDPQRVVLAFQGAQTLTVDAQGDLVVGGGGERIRWHRPMVYQEIAGHRRTIASKYVRRGRYQVGFHVDPYDQTHELMIDPRLAYSTYLGGSGQDESFGIDVDARRNAYVTGATDSANFPTKSAFQAQPPAGPCRALFPPLSACDVFVTKFDPTGKTLVYSTYLGGQKGDGGTAIRVDSSGNAYVTGYTYSNDFPTKNPYQAGRKGTTGS